MEEERFDEPLPEEGPEVKLNLESVDVRMLMRPSTTQNLDSKGNLSWSCDLRLHSPQKPTVLIGTLSFRIMEE